MNPRKGALTARQIQILDRMSAGIRYAAIGDELGLSVSTIKNQAHYIPDKFGAATMPEAVRTYATALAYRDAAARLRAVKGNGDEHVNHVLEGLAILFDREFDRRMPK